MKKLLCVLSILCLLLLCACARPAEDDEGGVTVDFENGTVFDGTNTYRFTFSGDREDYGVRITYPDGSTYWWNKSGSVGSGGWSDDYVEGRYISGDILCELIASKAARPRDPANPAKVVFALLAIAIGAFSAASPRTAWYWSYGWRYKDAEPSDLALSAERVGGVIAIVVGVFLLIS